MQAPQHALPRHPSQGVIPHPYMAQLELAAVLEHQRHLHQALSA